ncbi:MAG: aminoacyl-tRNA hydrolase [Chthoniobacterales bacterium]|nr:aminoacyl-tRNA hydrolase [Chthoniobacterales bacterium]
MSDILPIRKSSSFQPPASSLSPRLIIGLGNPGRNYDGTRHNIGFAVVDALAASHGCSFSFESKWNAEVASVSSSLVLMKPRTFMNLSGTAVSTYTRFFKILAQEVIVVLDDVSLPLGALRIRRGGSAGGHRGLESILTHFSTEEVPRLRLGIGEKEKSEEAPLSDFVLSRFHDQELVLVKETIQRTLEALEYLQREGLDKTMNYYNITP